MSESNADDTIRWIETPNPPPEKGAKVKWRTTQRSGQLSWYSSNTRAITVSDDGDSPGAATLTVQGLGMSTITATWMDGPLYIGSASRMVGVGELCAYLPEPSQVFCARSSSWEVTSRPIQIPPLGLLDRRAMAYVCEDGFSAIVLNLGHLFGLLNGSIDSAAYFRANEGELPQGPLPVGTKTYAYAPDGALWKIDYAPWKVAEPTKMPSNFPRKDEMNAQNAALAWAPPSDLPDPAPAPSSSPGATVTDAGRIGTLTYASEHVTCFVLNQDMFPGREPTGTTYYTFSKIPDTST